MRTKQDVAESQLNCIYANYLVSGKLKVEQSGRSNFLNPGDLVFYNGSLPVTLTTGDDPDYEVFAFLIPKHRFCKLKNAEVHFNNMVVTNEQMIKPLSSCLEFLAHGMPECSKEEVTSLFDAFVSLLPVATGYFKKSERESITESCPNYLLREILDFQNISDCDLSPQKVADHIGISVRYVHKLFAVHGTTFSSFVVATRLDHAAPICSYLHRLASRYIALPIGGGSVICRHTSERLRNDSAARLAVVARRSDLLTGYIRTRAF